MRIQNKETFGTAADKNRPFQFFTKRKAAAQHAFLFPAAGNSVNRSIRLIVQPPSVFDSLISRIIATDKCKHTGNFRLIFCSPLLFDHITVSVTDIFFYDFQRRIVVFPLVRIARPFHLTARISINRKYLFDILWR